MSDKRSEDVESRPLDVSRRFMFRRDGRVEQDGRFYSERETVDTLRSIGGDGANQLAAIARRELRKGRFWCLTRRLRHYDEDGNEVNL
jgi:hypothetical protein